MVNILYPKRLSHLIRQESTAACLVPETEEREALAAALDQLWPHSGAQLSMAAAAAAGDCDLEGFPTGFSLCEGFEVRLEVP